MPTGISSALAGSLAGTSGTSGAKSSASTTGSGTVTNPTAEDPQMFLKLLASSMANQDPMEPQDSSQFLNQMTQYSTIESMSAMKSSLSDMTSFLQSMNMYSVLNNATAIVGKEVEAKNNSGTGTTKGVVDKIQIDNDGIYMVINGDKFKYTQLLSVNKN